MSTDVILSLDPEKVIRLVMALAMGAVIGLERQLKKRPAGLRTHMLVSVGSAIFTITGLSLEPNTSRIAEAIVTGIGFRSWSNHCPRRQSKRHYKRCHVMGSSCTWSCSWSWRLSDCTSNYNSCVWNTTD